jgi:hypothetical protein
VAGGVRLGVGVGPGVLEAVAVSSGVSVAVGVTVAEASAVTARVADGLRVDVAGGGEVGEVAAVSVGWRSGVIGVAAGVARASVVGAAPLGAGAAVSGTPVGVRTTAIGVKIGGTVATRVGVGSGRMSRTTAMAANKTKARTGAASAITIPMTIELGAPRRGVFFAFRDGTIIELPGGRRWRSGAFRVCRARRPAISS